MLVEGAGSAVGSQSARKRHRQYGLRPRRRRAGGADRRYRPRRRDREPRRHQGGDRAGGRRAGARLHRQQVPRRSGACSPPAWRRSRRRPAGRRSAWCRIFADARLLPAEDALALEQARPAKPDARVRIAVPILPHIANFDDLDPLEAEPAVDLIRVRPGAALPGDADLVILPGSKATIADLAALRAAGFDIDIAAHRRRGGIMLGLCGGYQMLGRIIADPGGHRRPARDRRGPRPARRRNHAVRREAARAVAGGDAPTARRFPATKCIWA